MARLLRRDDDVTVASCGGDAIEHIVVKRAPFDPILGDVMYPTWSRSRGARSSRRVATEAAEDGRARTPRNEVETSKKAAGARKTRPHAATIGRLKSLATTLPGVMLFELDVFSDRRGRFIETFRRDRYAALGIAHEFVQDNMSTSLRGTLRGLHYRLGSPEGKLVHVTQGAIFDVALDVRKSSPTFGQWFGATLSADNHRQLWIPPGFAHGFYALADADIAYKVTGAYSPTHERAIRWDDRELAIEWPLAGAAPLVSDKDEIAPALRDAELLP